MRICLFTPTFFPTMGGVEVWCDVMARGLMKRGHEVVVLAQKMGGPRPMPPLPYPVITFRRPPKQHLWAEVLAWPLRKAWKRYHFDVVMTVYGYPLGYAASRVKKRLGFGTVAVAHGNDLYDRFLAQRKWRFKALTKRGYQNADQVVAVSETLAQRLRAMLGDGGRQVHIIPNGIDLQEWRQQQERARQVTEQEADVARELGISPGKFSIQVAGLRPIKRQDLAIRAIARLRDFYERLDVKHVLVGEGKSLAEYHALAEELDIGKRVIFAGLRTGTQKAWLFAHARFLLNTSDEEGLPIVLIEAAASGLPILASDIQPHTDFLATTGCGRTFEKGNWEYLATRLKEMWTEDGAAMAAAALRRGEDFSADRMIDSYVQVCQRTIAARPVDAGNAAR